MDTATNASATKGSVMEASVWPQVSVATLADRVYSVMRDRILAGELEAGAFIRELDVSRAMGVSRTPVREALARLASEGLVERLPHRGFRVAEEVTEDLLEVYPILAALEVLVVRTVLPRLDMARIARLRDIARELRAGMTRDETDRWVELTREFWRALSERCGNRKLRDLVDHLRARVHRLELRAYGDVARREECVRRHEAIVEALEEGGAARVLELVERARFYTLASLRAELVSDRSGLPASA